MDNRKVHESSEYSFTLYPKITLPIEAKFIITLPPQLRHDGTSCSSTKGSCNIHNSNIYEMTVTNVLTTEYTDLSQGISFNISMIQNPEFDYDFTFIQISVKSIGGVDELLIEDGVIRIDCSQHTSYEIRYLLDNELEYNTHTATITEYKFTFKNPQYAIPADSIIKISIPESLTVLTPLPELKDTNGLDSNAYAIYSDNHIKIFGGFPTDISCVAGTTLSFVVANILNPMKLGTRTSFKIHIYKSMYGQHVKSFKKTMDADITDLAIFPQLNITVPDKMTGSTSTYTFQVQVGDAGIKSGHYITIVKPPQVQYCNSTSIDGADGLTVGGREAIDDDTDRFLISNTVAPNAIIGFNISCMNPYTLAPSADFALFVSDGTDSYYTGTVIFPTMETTNSFQYFYFASGNLYPMFSNYLEVTLEFSIHESISGNILNKIIMTIPYSMIINGCNVTDEDNNGLLDWTCSNTTDKIILTNTYKAVVYGALKIRIHDIINPQTPSEAINMSIKTKDKDGYEGEEITTGAYYPECSYPCMTCSTNINSCTSCSPLPYYNGDMINMFLTAGNYCYENCPTHTYNNSPTTCAYCSNQCSECSNSNTFCTECYSNLYLRDDNTCHATCDTGFITNNATFTCDHIGKIYIYIYIFRSRTPFNKQNKSRRSKRN